MKVLMRLKILSYYLAVLTASWFMCSCADVQERLNSGWRVIDPAGHHRYHRDRYYPHERKIGISIPGDAGR
jgi:hypothetical protein